MKVRLKKFLMISSLTPLVFCYTNCSGGGFPTSTSDAGGSQSASSAPPSDSSTPGDSSTPADSTTPAPSPSPSPTVTPTPAPTVSPSPTPSPTPPTTSGKVTVIMATGHQARTTLSCDGGRSWIYDRSDNPNARCWVDGDPNFVECDHTAVSSMGNSLAFGNGYFYAQYGWGVDGSIRRSVDGVNWQVMRTGDWAGGIGFNAGRVFSLWGDWTYSNDNGSSWFSSTKSFSQWDMSHPLISQTTSRLFAVGRSDMTLQMAYSADGGLHWTTVPSYKSEWGASFAENSSGVIVSLGTTAGLVARSVDGGKTWTTSQAHSSTTDTWSSPLLYNGTQFVAFAGGKRYTSADGLTWTATTMVNAPASGPAAYNPSTKTYSVIQNEWNNYYAKQKAWVSSDAVTWTQLTSTQFKGGHPLMRMVIGEVDRSVCP